jgi:ribosomal protein L37AE/L43A
MRQKEATCPSCGKRGRFTHSGTQHWPQAVAPAHNLPPVIHLWTCPHCPSTLSEVALFPDSRPVPV